MLHRRDDRYHKQEKYVIILLTASIILGHRFPLLSTRCTMSITFYLSFPVVSVDLILSTRALCKVSNLGQSLLLQMHISLFPQGPCVVLQEELDCVRQNQAIKSHLLVFAASSLPF